MLRTAAACAAFALASPALAQTPAPTPLAAYARLPAIEDAGLSPDGARVAAVETDGEKRRVRIRSFAGETLGRLDAGERRVRFLDWAGPDHVVVVTRQAFGPFETPAGTIPRQDGNIALAYDVAARQATVLLRNIPGLSGAINSNPRRIRHEGAPAVVVTGLAIEGGSFNPTLYRVDLRTGRAVALSTGALDAGLWLTRPDGALAARTRLEPGGAWTLQARRGNGWTNLAQVPADLPAPYLLGFGRDGRSLLVSGGRDGADGLYEVSPETGAWSGPLQDAVLAPSHLFDRGGDGRLLAALDVEERPLIYDPVLRSAWAVAGRSFPGKRLRLLDLADDRRTLLLGVSDPGAPESVYVLDLDAKRADLVGEDRPDLPETAVSPTRDLAFTAADGTALTGRLTTPRGRADRGLPLVVLVQAVSNARASNGFDWIGQALAARGYAVLEIDSRDSGFGRRRAGDGQFGRKLQTDLSDGVRHLASTGLVDPARVCILGMGDGGYAAAAAVTVQTGLYRCAVALDPQTDPRRTLSVLKEASTAGGRIRYADRRRLMGADNPADRSLEAISPIRLAANGRAPVLLIQAVAEDAAARDGRAFEAALRRAGRSVQRAEIPGEDPTLLRGASRLAFLNSVVAFLETHNPPR